ncbi:hypothetical protein H098_24490 [Pseudomonas fluorescens FH5]|nr:hypothetical protein H098_24490 [Pseudomonas fluorescens FH5]
MRVYICGPCTGFENFNYPAFNAEAARLRAMGIEVENPAENIEPVCASWEGFMKIAIPQMLTCDTVATLPGWEHSEGAKLELTIAHRLGMTVVNAHDLVTREAV